MSTGTPPRPEPPAVEYYIGKETLEEFFQQKRSDMRVTRGQLRQILALYTSKPAVGQAMEVLEFNLRRSIREMIRQEREAAERDAGTKSGLILTPGGR